MLQLNKAQSTIGREPAEHEIVSVAESLQFFVGFARRQLPTIAFMTILAIAIGAIYLVTARPSFTAQTQLLIDAHRVQMFQQQSILGDVPLDTAQVESQIEVLKSENIASAVIKNLHLTDDPGFVGSGGGLIGALFHSSFASVLFGSDQDQAASEFEHQRAAIRAFQNQLSVKRIGLSYVIQIGFRSSSPEKSAQIANEVADAYIVDQLEAKYQATRRAGVWLQDRIKELRDQVSAAERAVVEFKTKNNIVSTGGTDKPLLNQQEVAELSSQLVLARAHSAEAKARLDRINAVLTSDSPNESFGATVTDTLKSDVVSKLRSQYLDLAARESDWSAKYGQNHIAVVNLRNQMREIRNSIFQELKRLGETYKSDYEIAKQREEGVQKELGQAVAQSQQTDVKSVALRELQSTAQTYKSLYDNFLQRYMESVQQQSFPITEARVISSASRPLTKSNPKTLLVLAVASLGGLIFGFGIGLLRDLSDRVFRTGDHIENLLQAECIGLVPLLTSDDVNGAPNSSKVKVDPDKPNAAVNSIFARIAEIIKSFSLVSDLQGTYKSTKRRLDTFNASFSPKEYPVAELSMKPKKAHAAPGQRTIKCDARYWTVVNAPFSRFTEAMRSIKLAVDLDLKNAVKSSRVIGFTSSLPNEGKSTIALALAQLISQTGKRVIVVDCDLRNPSLSRSLAPNASSGLLEILVEKASLDDVIFTEPTTNLTFLPAVVKSRLANSSEILNSSQTTKLFEKLRERYDFVIADFPPLAPVVDVHLISHLADSFIFVIEWGQTKIAVVEHALGHAAGVYENLLGVVLNKVDMNIFGRYASHRENYYYNKYFTRYGYTE